MRPRTRRVVPCVAGAFGVEDLQAYFCGIFAKNPLSPTDRLFFTDHLMAGAAEVLPAAAAETFADLLAKANLDCVYDSPAMGAHHALLRAVYGFSHGRAFQRRDRRRCAGRFLRRSAMPRPAVIDQQAGAVEKFIRAKETFLRKLGPQAGDPAFAAFLSKIETLTLFPAPCL